MQSMVFSKALTKRGALFKQQIYPDEGHNLAGVKKHLYRSMTLFFEECFRKQVQILSVSFLTHGFIANVFTFKIFVHSTGPTRGKSRLGKRRLSRANELELDSVILLSLDLWMKLSTHFSVVRIVGERSRASAIMNENRLKLTENPES